ncbi:MAG: leucine--tRNA ligase [Flavobacteriales bacterium]|nr:leucine--tRNA ligase [Flavobacteriales bacterium]
MDYNHRELEAKWQKYWADNKSYAADDNSDKPKYYGLTMFPYPSGAGLHVGHPLGYIASCIYARYKKLEGFNVLHPMGYDSFGLPAEQYAIQTGQHPALTTKNNIARYREQLDKIGFSFDWDREVKTSDPAYYKWTQWIFKQLYMAWYDNQADKARSIDDLIAEFAANGNANVDAATDQTETFTAEQWKAFSEKEQQDILMNYRLTFLADSWVNWCPALGTVLANDEIKDGVSERGGHPVEQKLMRQWSMRITAYAKRLLEDLDGLDWTDSLKDQQRNWIGKSQGASVRFKVENSEEEIEVFTTRPDTIFGVSFMVLAPEHELVAQLTTDEYKADVEAYQQQASLKTERDRQSDVKNITGQFTGAYAIHPFNGTKVQIWIGDYVLAGYGTGAVMAVPCGDQRDWDFANHFGIEIINIFKDVDVSEQAYAEKDAVIANSDFLNDLPAKKAIKRAIHEIEQKGIGKGKTNYRLRDAVFSRQRYWGEPFPVYYKNDIPQLIEDEYLPLQLPEVDKYLPTETGEPPLGNATNWSWDENEKTIKANAEQDGSSIWPLELNTMPGWAGSSWYFLRYMDPQNEKEFVSRERVDQWNQVDLYIGGTEHATGHLLYSRFWNQFLFDMGYIGFREPFAKMINQGMILGRSSFVYRDKESGKFVSFDKRKEYKTARMNVEISKVDNDKLDLEAFKNWMPEFNNAEFILNDNGEYICGHEIEKMSKSKYNVQTPDELVEKFGADTLRCYEMFLGPLEQSKPWDTKGINGVSNFLRKFWRLSHDKDGNFVVSDEEPSKDAMKTVHKTIKKVKDDLDRFSFNTGVSNFMIAVNELTEQKCNNRLAIEQLTIILSPYAPHICEEIWEKLGHTESITKASWPEFNEEYLVESAYAYPVSFNGKMRFKLELALDLSPADVEKEVLANEQAQKYLDGKSPKKVIVVPGKIVNVVV